MRPRNNRMSISGYLIDVAVFLIFFGITNHFWGMSLTDAAAGWALGTILANRINYPRHDGLH